MFSEFNTQLIEVKEDLQAQVKVERLLAAAEGKLSQQQAHLGKLAAQLHQEQADVEKLEGKSLTGLFYSILGDKDLQLKKERQEFLEAKLKYDQCQNEVDALKEEIAQLCQKRDQFGDLDGRYQALLTQKEQLLLDSTHPRAVQLIQLSERQGLLGAQRRELLEALEAGEHLLNGLLEVICTLKSAKNWGTWDMMGGGLVANIAKHSKINQAREQVHRVQTLLGRFQRELADVAAVEDMAVNLTSFETFADYFFDGLIMDWVVQSKIRDSLSRTLGVKDQVETIVVDLRRELANVNGQIESMEQERQALIEAA